MGGMAWVQYTRGPFSANDDGTYRMVSYHMVWYGMVCYGMLCIFVTAICMGFYINRDGSLILRAYSVVCA